MESFKQQVQAVQMCQSALQVPEEVMANLAICRTALRLQQEASQLQHVAIQQCNILQVHYAPDILIPQLKSIKEKRSMWRYDDMFLYFMEL